MIKLLKDKLRYTYLYNVWNRNYNNRKYNEWIISKDIMQMPSIVKEKDIIELAVENNIKVFIETGTFRGSKLYYLKDIFRDLYSIELNDKFYNYCVNKFKRYKNIHLFHGNSKDVLKELLKNIYEKSIFFLDAHYCGYETSGRKSNPILQELEIIQSHKINNHIIIIDDADCYQGLNEYTKKEYFPTIKELSECCKGKKLLIKDNMIFYQ